MKKAFLYETLDFLLNCGIIINEKGASAISGSPPNTA